MEIKIHDIQWTEDPLLNAYKLNVVQIGEAVAVLPFESRWQIIRIGIPHQDPRRALDLIKDPDDPTKEYHIADFRRDYVIDERGEKTDLWVRIT